MDNGFVFMLSILGSYAFAGSLVISACLGVLSPVYHLFANGIGTAFSKFFFWLFTFVLSFAFYIGCLAAMQPFVNAHT